ncbi:hypothetical protein THOB06_250008 [Vibrio rotiferianus]|nr:hypothetical protein THOB06_250008 [Vibrio rotiferianus]
MRLYECIRNYSYWQLRNLKCVAEISVDVTSNEALAPTGQSEDGGTDTLC